MCGAGLAGEAEIARRIELAERVTEKLILAGFAPLAVRSTS